MLTPLYPSISSANTAHSRNRPTERASQLPRFGAQPDHDQFSLSPLSEQVWNTINHPPTVEEIEPKPVRVIRTKIVRDKHLGQLLKDLNGKSFDSVEEIANLLTLQSSKEPKYFKAYTVPSDWLSNMHAIVIGKPELVLKKYGIECEIDPAGQKTTKPLIQDINAPCHENGENLLQQVANYMPEGIPEMVHIPGINLDVPKSYSNGGMVLHSLVKSRASASDAKAVEAMVKAGADLTLTDNEGHTPLRVAVDHANEESVKILLDAKADPNALDKKGHTVLDGANYVLAKTRRELEKNPFKEKAGYWEFRSYQDKVASAEHLERIIKLLQEHGAKENSPIVEEPVVTSHQGHRNQEDERQRPSIIMRLAVLAGVGYLLWNQFTPGEKKY